MFDYLAAAVGFALQSQKPLISNEKLCAFSVGTCMDIHDVYRTVTYSGHEFKYQSGLLHQVIADAITLCSLPGAG